MSKQQIIVDIREIIKNTIDYHELDNLSYSELIRLEIIDWVLIFISKLYPVSKKSLKNLIKKELKVFCQQKETIPKVINIETTQSDYSEDSIDNDILKKDSSDDTCQLKSINIDTIHIHSSEYCPEFQTQDTHVTITLTPQSTRILPNQNVIRECDFTNLPIEIITQRMNKLLSINLPEQRSKDWYLMRHNMITASDLYKVLGPPGNRRELLIKKSSPIDTNKQRSGGGDACKHGIKFEPIATRLYELRNQVEILEFGCIPHYDSNLPFGASPDGICGLQNERFAGRMLEIKCPYSREITGIVPEMYWKQVQGQLEVCDFEVCDFLECKITEYQNQEEFYEDGDEITTNNGMEKGAILVYSDLNNNYYYIYPEIGLSRESLLSYIDKETEKILNDSNKNYVTTCWWKLDLYSCVLIKRDREWFSSIVPKINSFWEEVEKYRLIGNDTLIKQKKIRVKKKKETLESIDICLIDSDDESK